ncbi:MAG: HypC/HybG/HupF family hydrogenase formation chaperone [Euzebyales bacterium]|nr:HypC/HybG/HupF family hydrogenase formation chaperone [Euzebyales bacterium]
MCLGMPAQVVELSDGGNQTAVVDIAGRRQEISLALLAEDAGPGASVGDWVLVHLGLAMTKLEASEAAEVRASLQEFGPAFEFSPASEFGHVPTDEPGQHRGEVIP